MGDWVGFGATRRAEAGHMKCRKEPTPITLQTMVVETTEIAWYFVYLSACRSPVTLVDPARSITQTLIQLIQGHNSTCTSRRRDIWRFEAGALVNVAAGVLTKRKKKRKRNLQVAFQLFKPVIPSCLTSQHDLKGNYQGLAYEDRMFWKDLQKD